MWRHPYPISILYGCWRQPPLLMDHMEYEKLVEQSMDYLRACSDKANRYFGIGGYARYEYDLFRNEIWWSDASGPKVRGKLTVVGSTSKKSGTWLWAWANPHFDDVEIGPIDRVREFGEKEGITRLADAKWEAAEEDGWEMMAISARLLESQGVYRSPNASGDLFLLYDGLEFIPEDEMSKYSPLKHQE